jgi:hypothetical protein
LEAQIGVPVRIVNFYLQWPASPSKGGFPERSLEVIHKFGALACITWEPMYYELDQEQAIDAESILKGEYDPYLRRFAKSATKWGQRFILRFAHEMNIQRYHWGTTRSEYGPQSPGLYQDLFRYVVNLFRKNGASNVLFAFCPNAESVPNTSFDPSAAWNTIPAYYPGDSHVDILGLDGYNWGQTREYKTHGWTSSWQGFSEIFASAIKELKGLGQEKPLVIFETASAKQKGDLDQWLISALQDMEDWGVKGLCWFQVNKELDWGLKAQDAPKAIPLLRRQTSPALHWIKR